MTDLPAVGHNNPPDDEFADLRERHADILARRDALIEAVDKIAKITSAADAGRAADYVKMCRVAWDKLQDAAIDERRPFRESIDAITALLANGEMDTAIETVEAALHAWRMTNPDVVVVGEYGSIAHWRTHTVVTIDRTTLDLEALRPYLPAAALETAVRATRKNGVLPRGVTVAETRKTVVR
jgi:hypothetical protein